MKDNNCALLLFCEHAQVKYLFIAIHTAHTFTHTHTHIVQRTRMCVCAFLLPCSVLASFKLRFVCCVFFLRTFKTRSSNSFSSRIVHTCDENIYLFLHLYYVGKLFGYSGKRAGAESKAWRSF